MQGFAYSSSEALFTRMKRYPFIMCGIFGFVSPSPISSSSLRSLAKHATQRGKDSSGLAWLDASGRFGTLKGDISIEKLFPAAKLMTTRLAVGHSRLITNGMDDNQPVIRGGVLVLHNGIVVNHEEIWTSLPTERELSIDTEVIAAIADEYLKIHQTLEGVGAAILSRCLGSISCAIVAPETGELALFSNTGSLYAGRKNEAVYFSSESFPLEQMGAEEVRQITHQETVIFPKSELGDSNEIKIKRRNLVPAFNFVHSEEALLEFLPRELHRCSKCILPSTMPFISFNSEGVCNYCQNYKIRNSPRPVSELFNLLEGYRRLNGPEVIMPFSGGRDSSYALHLVAKEFGLKSIAFTYDWGMVTDLGRRNISRMCAELGVENIVVAADIERKRQNIKMNLVAWLAKPHLGMLSLLTAGDKHFFKYVDSIKNQTGVNLNLWGVNPLETTHFKAGFLGVAPDFLGEKVYRTGLGSQLEYQGLRFKEMLRNPKYFNTSIPDTVSGEYFRSVAPKTDYFHLFDFWKWDETEIDKTLIDDYGWETARDTTTTWRIGDGTAAFYNYVYFTVGGFSEHDTFRSNQIREGDISRSEAMAKALEENRPRYENLRWYLDAVGVDFVDAIKTVNRIPKIH